MFRRECWTADRGAILRADWQTRDIDQSDRLLNCLLLRSRCDPSAEPSTSIRADPASGSDDLRSRLSGIDDDFAEIGGSRPSSTNAVYACAPTHPHHCRRYLRWCPSNEALSARRPSPERYRYPGIAGRVLAPRSRLLPKSRLRSATDQDEHKDGTCRFGSQSAQ